MSESVFSVCPHVTAISPITAAIVLKEGAWRPDTASTSLMILHEGAEAIYRIGDEIFTAPVGALILLPIGANVTAEITRGGSVILVGFVTAEMNVLSSAMLFERPSANAKKAILHLIGAFQSKKEGWELAILSDLYTTLYAIVRDSRTGNRRFLQNELIHPSIAYLEKHLFDRRLSIREVAALSGVSETYFRSLFVRRFGVTPVQYVNRERIKYAKQMLSNGTPLPDAIRLCGFSDRASFLRAYERATGKEFTV